MATQVNPVDDSDRISSLPDSILSHILSFLPTKEAIRTSVLSPRWRYLFASMSTFDFGRDCLQSLASRNGNNFKNFVDRLLHSPNPVSLECFRLYSFFWDDDESHLNGWISALLSRGVKELDLYAKHSHKLSPHLFTSHSLVTLKLDTYGDIKVPTDVCLRNLKTLHLKEFTLLDDSIYRLISSCVVLEELDLMPEEMHVSEVIIRNPSLKRLFLYLAVKGGRKSNQLVEINAPNLVQFDYADDLAERYVLSDMNSLKKAYIRTYDSDDCAPTNLLRAICNVQSLYLKVDLSPMFSRTSLEPVLAFNNLVELELSNPLVEWLVEFLHSVPNLKSLNISQVLADDEEFWFIPNKVPSCLSIHLQEITLTFFFIDNLMVGTVWYFLNHALVLEKLRVCIFNEHLKEDSCILKKLLKLVRIRSNDAYLKEKSSSIKKLLKLLRIGIDELYSKEETSIFTKPLRLHGSRAIEVSVELKDQT